MSSFRSRFPILSRKVNGRPLIYLDNAATTLKPKEVIDSINEFYCSYTANIHRGAHILSEKASNEFENVRQLVASYLNTSSTNVVFTSGTTEALQLVANGLGRSGRIKVISSEAEHHSNLLPWTDGELHLTAVDKFGRISFEQLEEDVRRVRPDVVCISHASNVTGNINPVSDIAEMVHRHGALFVVDAAQSIPHMSVAPETIGCDFMAFSAHKMMGPSGVGVLWGTAAALERLGTPKRGGGMVNHVAGTTFVPREIPWRFEAGTPNIEGVIGLGAALRLLMEGNQRHFSDHQQHLSRKLSALVAENTYLIPLGDFDQNHRLSLVSFALRKKNVHSDQFARILSDSFGIMARSGSLCAHPLFKRMGFQDAVRISAYHYNTLEELEQLRTALADLSKLFG